MSMEVGFEIDDKKKEKSVESLFAELPSVGEAIQKFDDPGLRTISWSIYSSEYTHGKSQDEKKEIAKNFETEVWLVYEEAIRSLLKNDEFHKKVLEASGYLTNTQLRELVHGLDFVRDEIFEEVLHRVDMLLRHSVDTDLMCLMFKDLLRGQINGSTQQVFSESEVEMLSKTFNEDSKCQSNFVLAIMNTRGVEYGNGLGEDDTKFAENFIKRLTKLSNAEDVTTFNKLEGLFFNRDTEELGQVFSSEFRNILVKDSLAMVNLFVPKSTEVNSSLTNGRKDYLLERARKLEVVKLLMKVEQLQNETLGFSLDETDKYIVRENSSQSTNVSSLDKIVEYHALDDLSDVGSNHWFNKPHEALEVFGEWHLERKLMQLKRVIVPRWVSAWSDLVHERAHMKFIRFFVKNQSDTMRILGAKKSSELSFDYVPIIELRGGGIVENNDVLNGTYRLKIYDSLNEGYSVLIQNLSNKYLVSDQSYIDPKDENNLKMLMSLRASRFVADIYENNHYWLGYKIVSSLFLHGYRDLSGHFVGLKEELDLRQKSGFSYVEDYLNKLDLNKITSRESRRLFETTRFEDDVEAPEVRRKVWIEDGDKMKLVWQVDKKNTLLDYMASTNPEKRKKGQEKFLELFGK